MSFDIRQLEIDLPEDWSTVSIKDIASVNSDTIRQKDQPASIYYIDISSVSNGAFDEPKFMNYKDAPSRAKRRLKNNDIIISTVRPNLRQHVLIEKVQSNWVASTGFAVVSANDSATAWYLYAVLTSDIFNEHLVRVADGGAYPAFNPKEIEDAIIPWPNSASLEIINATVKSFFNKIALNSQINQTLEAMAQALFKSWFVDFDPVKAKMTARTNGGDNEAVRHAAMTAISGKSAEELATFRSANPEAYTELAATADLFPEALIESELGLIPEGWEVKKIEDVAERVAMGPFGSNIKVSTFVDEGVPIISGQHLHEIMLVDNENNFITKEHAEKLKNSKVSRGDIIFTHAGSIGQVAIIPEHSAYEEYVISQRQFYLRIDSCFASKWFILFFFKSHIGQHALLSNASQVGVPSIARPSSHLKSIEFISPALKIQTIYENTILQLMRTVGAKINVNKNLSQSRDTLLPKLLSGEIDLSSFGDQEVSE